MYKLYTGIEIAEAIKVVRAEMTEEEFRHDLQREILAKQEQLLSLKLSK
jgi:hypothetical protein